MRYLPHILSLALPLCHAKEPNMHQNAEPDKPAPESPQSGPLPGPQRAREAAERVRPGLERDLAAKDLRFGDPVFLRAFKEEETLEVWVLDRTSRTYRLFRSYPIAAASGDTGPKLAEGDRQVPEGFYYVPRSRMKPDSTFHLAFNIGYPNDYDRHHGRDGSFIMIHGNCVSIGCLAMTDARIEEIYTLCDAALAGGQRFFRVHIFPFVMSDSRISKVPPGHRWLPYWKNLKEGYDRFERDRTPPDTTVRNGRYVFD